MSSHPELTETKDGVVLAVRVHPGAGSTGLIGRHGAALKVRVGAPPTGGRANDAVIALVADLFGLKPAEVVLVSGQTSRDKRVRLGTLDLEAAGDLADLALRNAATRP